MEHRPLASKLLMLLAFIFFLLQTLITGGVFSSSVTWLLPAGLASLALAFLVA
jgi:hypothetical protein